MSDGGKRYSGNVTPFPVHNTRVIEAFSPIDWDNVEPEPLEWLVQGCIPKRTVVMFSGDSGLGKSLLMQQLQTSCATGRPWLGHEVQRVKSFGFYCEDPRNILHWRQRSICKHLDVDMTDLDDMRMVERVGMDNTLMDFNRRNDESKLTFLFDHLRGKILEFGSQLTIIDTLAHTFGGNENIRIHATAFVGALQEIANETDGSVVLCAHPSVASMQSGTGYSGSTAWRASVRAHMYLKRPQGYNDEAEDADHDARILKTMKSNWGPGAGILKLRWDDGVFVAENAQKKAAVGKGSQMELEYAISKGVRYYLGKDQKLAVSPQAPKTYIVKMLMQLPSLEEYERAAIISAIERMEKEGRLVQVPLGPKSNRHMFYRTPEVRYASE
jgi:RecA-family ATPase